MESLSNSNKVLPKKKLRNSMITVQKILPFSDPSSSLTSPDESTLKNLSSISSSVGSKSDYLRSSPLDSKYKIHLRVSKKTDVRRVLRGISGSKLDEEVMTNEQ